MEMEMIIKETPTRPRSSTKHIRKPSPLHKDPYLTRTHRRNIPSENSPNLVPSDSPEMYPFLSKSQRKKSDDMQIKIEHSKEIFPQKAHNRVASNQNYLSGFEIRSNNNMTLSGPRDHTVLTTNLSSMSMLSENIELGNLVRGIDKASIHVRGKTFVFDQADRIFDVMKPLRSSQWKEGEICNFCGVKFKKLRKSQTVSQKNKIFKHKHANCQLCAEAYCKNCVTTKRRIHQNKKEKEDKW